jgi:hypothetical protein
MPRTVRAAECVSSQMTQSYYMTWVSQTLPQSTRAQSAMHLIASLTAQIKR